MFGNLRFGYWTLIALSFLYFGMASIFGNSALSRMVSFSGWKTLFPIWVLPGLIWFGIVAVELAKRRVDRPTITMLRLASLHRSWLFRGLLFTAMAIPIAQSFGSFKVAIPNLVPFYADHYFVAADHLIFGTDPWRLTHAIFGPVGTLVIDRVYAAWFFAVMVLLGWLNFTHNQKLQLRGLLSYLLALALVGNGLAIAFSSVGPCFFEEFYGDDRFHELMTRMRETNEVHTILALKAMNYLLSSFGTEKFGSGISAMPSLHVSMAFLCFLVSLESTKRLWPKLLTGAFAATIMVGSVHLGWHYAVDGIAGILGVTLIWIAAGRFVDWVEARHSKNQPAPPHLIRLEPA